MPDQTKPQESQNFLGKYLPDVLSALSGVALGGLGKTTLGALFLGGKNYLGNVNRNRQYLHNILDENRNKVGYVNVYENPRDNILHIGEMSTALPSTLPTQHPARWANPHSQAIGYSNMRDLIRQLQQEYPYATKITGTKIGGAHAFSSPLEKPIQPMKGHINLPQTEEQRLNNESLEGMRNNPNSD